MRARRRLYIFAGLLLVLGPLLSLAQQGPLLVFAVVTEIPQDKRQVTARVFVNGEISTAVLLPSERARQNVMWRQLEVCQCLKAEARKVLEGYTFTSFRMLSPSMLPMPLQGIAGECMLKKALEFAPRLDRQEELND